MQLKELGIDIVVWIHDHSEVIVGTLAFPCILSVDVSDELAHATFTITGSVLSGVLVWIIKLVLDKNKDSIYNKYFKRNGKKNKNS